MNFLSHLFHFEDVRLELTKLKELAQGHAA